MAACFPTRVFFPNTHSLTHPLTSISVSLQLLFFCFLFPLCVCAGVTCAAISGIRCNAAGGIVGVVSRSRGTCTHTTHTPHTQRTCTHTTHTCAHNAHAHMHTHAHTCTHNAHAHTRRTCTHNTHMHTQRTHAHNAHAHTRRTCPHPCIDTRLLAAVRVPVRLGLLDDMEASNQLCGLETDRQHLQTLVQTAPSHDALPAVGGGCCCCCCGGGGVCFVLQRALDGCLTGDVTVSRNSNPSALSHPRALSLSHPLVLLLRVCTSLSLSLSLFLARVVAAVAGAV